MLNQSPSSARLVNQLNIYTQVSYYVVTVFIIPVLLSYRDCDLPIVDACIYRSRPSEIFINSMFVETQGVTDRILHSEVFVSATEDKFLPSDGWFYRWLIISIRPDNCTHCCLSQATLLLLNIRFTTIATFIHYIHL